MSVLTDQVCYQPWRGNQRVLQASQSRQRSGTSEDQRLCTVPHWPPVEWNRDRVEWNRRSAMEEKHVGMEQRRSGMEQSRGGMGMGLTFIPRPYLCMSADMEVTPGNRKSNSGTGYPNFSTLGRLD